ncbi:EcsC family protein [Stutzerimonas stutzeri]|uniref:EcsC family protein n=1 Tax=Stutzerimonas stutzeri TaxID=316 RepID=UPI00210EA4E5|nr:EcsC family protein [Stutzerimonas stutzeri]MCQ4241910.1 EcsC family protein [Stutzerimonas stutzeri]
MSTTEVAPDDKPKLLQAVELILAKPDDIKRESLQVVEKIRTANPTKQENEIRKLASKKIISNYSYFAAFAGGTTALTGVIPGIGTAVAITGGASTDAVACMKFQIEMTMALATVYGHDILIEEEKRLCYLIAGLGAMSQAGKEGGKAVGSKAFIKLAQQYLKGPTLQAVKEIFKKLGITFTRKALEKAIPFGVGVVVGFSANKGLTWYVGSKAQDFFSESA